MVTAVLLAHPDLAASRANRALLAGLDDVPGVEVADLYALYPDERIDFALERNRLLRADRLVLQFPMFWYSTPPLLKRWQDDLLTPLIYIEPEAAEPMRGLSVMAATTTAGPAESYQQEGMSVEELFAPLRATARKAGWLWQTPFALHGVRTLEDETLSRAVDRYRAAVRAIPALHQATGVAP